MDQPYAELVDRLDEAACAWRAALFFSAACFGALLAIAAVI